MPGSAILDPNVLVDSLVPGVIDGLRGSLHPAFGVRSYRVFTVLEEWTGQNIGQGTKSETVLEIDPQPLVDVWTGLRFELSRCGLDEVGEIRLREVSLTYTEAELVGVQPLAINQRWLIRLSEAHGQLNDDKYFIHAKPPFVDREKDMGWVMWLRASERG